MRPAPVESETVGPQKMLVALFNFSDVPSRPFTREFAQARILTDLKATDKFIQENSYGKTRLDVTVQDWITIPGNSLEICPGST